MRAATPRLGSATTTGTRAPGYWADMDAVDTVAKRRRWYLALVGVRIRGEPALTDGDSLHATRKLPRTPLAHSE